MELITQANRPQFKFARDLTANFARSFYFSAGLLPKQKRWATYALYGFCRYVDNMIDVPRDRSLEEIQSELSFLENEIRVAYRTGESQHPILSPFITVARHYHIPMGHALELIEGVRMDTHKKRYENFDELYLFAYRVAGVVGLMMTPLLGYREEKALEHAEKLGIAMQLTNILRDVQEDLTMDRVYLPLDEMQDHNVSLKDMFDQKMTPELKALMRSQVERAHQYYQEADQGIRMLDRDAQFAIYSASKIYRGILHKIELRDYNPFLGRVFVPQRKKMRIVATEVLRTRAFPFSAGLERS